MNQTEFLSELTKWLYLKQIPDVEDIMLEYRQHFALNLADGYSEEEIAAKLGTPKELANQFEAGTMPQPKRRGASAVAAVGLVFIDIFACLLGILLAAWVIVLAAATVAFGVLSVCLLFQQIIHQWIPNTPTICQFFYAVSFLALAILSLLATWYCFLFVKQLTRVYFRWRRNIFFSAMGDVILPPLSMYPSIGHTLRRKMRGLALGATTVFGVGIVVSYVLSSVLAGSFEFWHVWGWFVS
jgi:uncharacterized membrane protein